MRIIEITLSFIHKTNLTNYQSMDVGVGATAVFNETEDYETVAGQLREQLMEQIKLGEVEFLVELNSRTGQALPDWIKKELM